MPAYRQGDMLIPLQDIRPGGIGATVWSAESPAAGAKSLAVTLARTWEMYPPSASIELTFDSAPGAFEVDVQVADTDVDTSYGNVPGAIITQVSPGASGNVARLDLSPIHAKFLRLLMKTPPATAKVTAKITQ